MIGKRLKTLAPVQQEPPLRSTGTRPDAAALRRVAAEAGRSIPPAVVQRSRRTVLVNVKVSEELAIALADRAEAEGITQKQVITRALAAAGLPVDALDLEDRSPKRRRTA